MRLCYYRVLREADTFCTVGMRHRLTQGSLYSCVFHGKAATDSRGSLPLIPRQSCHPFHTKAATDSIASLPPIPGESCH
jgi:hypothetical protein